MASQSKQSAPHLLELAVELERRAEGLERPISKWKLPIAG
jgi:hypothetical protein